MKKFGDKLYTVTNYNELSVIDIESKEIEKTVLFQDMNITAIHVNELYLIVADHFNYVYVIKIEDIDVDIFLIFFRMRRWRRRG